MKTVEVQSKPVDTAAGPGEIRVVRDQKAVREILGDEIMNMFVEEGANLFLKLQWGQYDILNSGVFVFLAFNEDGQGRAYIADREEVSLKDDDDIATIIRFKLTSRFGADKAYAIFARAKQKYGWKD